MSNSPSRAGSPSNQRVNLVNQQDTDPASGASGGAINIAGVNAASNVRLSTQDLNDPSYIQQRDAQVERMVETHAPGSADNEISLENLLSQGAILGDHVQNIWAMPVLERESDGSIKRDRNGKPVFSVSTYHPGISLRETFTEVIDLQNQGYEGYDDAATDLAEYWKKSADIKINKDALVRNGFRKVENVPRDIRAIAPSCRLYSLELMVNGLPQTAYWFEGMSPREMLVIWHEENLSEVLEGVLPPTYPLPDGIECMPQGYAKTSHKMRIETPEFHPILKFNEEQIRKAGFEPLDDACELFWWSPEDDANTIFLWDPSLPLRLNREQILKTTDLDPLSTSDDPDEIHRYPSADEVARKLLNEVGTEVQKTLAQLDRKPVSLQSDTYTQDDLKSIGFKRTDSTPQDLKNLGITRLYRKPIPVEQRTGTEKFHEWMVGINEARIARIQAGRPDPDRASVSQTADFIRQSLALGAGAEAPALPPDDGKDSDDDKPGPSGRKPDAPKPHPAPDTKKSDKKPDDDSGASGRERVPQLTHSLRFATAQLDKLGCFDLDPDDPIWSKADSLIKQHALVCFYPTPDDPHYYLWGANNQTVATMESLTQEYERLTQDEYLLPFNEAVNYIYQGIYGETSADTRSSAAAITPPEALASSETFSVEQLMRVGFNLVLRGDPATSYSLDYNKRMRHITASDGRHHLWMPNANLEDMRAIHQTMVENEAASGTLNPDRLHPENTFAFIKFELAKLAGGKASLGKKDDGDDDEDGDDKPDSKKDRSAKPKVGGKPDRAPEEAIIPSQVSITGGRDLTELRQQLRGDRVEEAITPSQASITGGRDLTELRQQLRSEKVEEEVLESRFRPLKQPESVDTDSSEDEGDKVDISLTGKRFERIPSPDIRPKLKPELLASWSRKSGMPVSTALRTYQASTSEFVDVSAITGVIDESLSDYDSESDFSFDEDEMVGASSKFKTIDSDSDKDRKTKSDFFDQYGASEPPPDAIYTKERKQPIERPIPQAPKVDEIAIIRPKAIDKTKESKTETKSPAAALQGKYGRKAAPSTLVTRTQQRSAAIIPPKMAFSSHPEDKVEKPKTKLPLKQPVQLDDEPVAPKQEAEAAPIKKPVAGVKKDAGRPRKVQLGKKVFTASVAKKPTPSDGSQAAKTEVKSLVSPAAMMAALRQERGATLPARLTPAQLRDPKFTAGERQEGPVKRAYAYRRAIPGLPRPEDTSSDESGSEEDGFDVGAYAARLQAEASKTKDKEEKKKDDKK